MYPDNVVSHENEPGLFLTDSGQQGCRAGPGVKISKQGVNRNTGVIDAVTGFTSYGWYKFGIHEISRYMTWPSLWIPAASMEVVVNMKAWNSLPPDLQAIFEIAVDRWHNDMWMTDKLANLEAIEAMKASGLEEIFLPEEDVKKIQSVAVLQQRCSVVNLLV